MTDIEILLATEEIKTLKARYLYYVDTKNWMSLLDIWAIDAQWEAETPNGVISNSGAENIVNASKRNVGRLLTVHLGHSPDIVINSKTTATGRWAMEDILKEPEGQISAHGWSYLHGFGHYHETYECCSGRWKIKTMKITRLYVDVAV